MMVEAQHVAKGGVNTFTSMEQLDRTRPGQV